MLTGQMVLFPRAHKRLLANNCDKKLIRANAQRPTTANAPMYAARLTLFRRARSSSIERKVAVSSPMESDLDRYTS